MKRSTRAYRLYAAALARIGIESDGGGLGPDTQQLFEYIAAAVDAATSKKYKCKHTCSSECLEGSKAVQKLLYTEVDVLKALAPVELHPSRFGRLTKQLQSMALEPTDLAAFATWFTDSMHPWLVENDVPMTYELLCRKYGAWLERARAYVPRTTTKSTENWR